MTNIKRRKYSKEFKEEAVALVSTQGYSIAEAARNLGIRGNILSRWRREHQTQQQGAFPGTGRQSPELEELKHLREENRKLKLEREILKKAAAFFARESG